MARDTAYTQRALAANDEDFGDDGGFQEASTSSLAPILERLERQTGIAQNVETPDDDGDANSLYVSRAGFDTLFGESPPRMLFIPEGTNARERPPEAVVDQVVLHSFGYAIDRVALRSGAKSIQVDTLATGHNPYKVAQRVQQLLFQRQQSTSHLITRRGDIISATPWNRGPAKASVGAARNLHVPDRAISIELESWHNGYNVRWGDLPEEDFKVLAQAPYTPRQLTALSFLLKKLSVWSGEDVSAPLGFTYAEVRDKLGSAGGHAPGIVAASVLANNRRESGPGGEFEYPPGWVTGDPHPSHLNEALYQMRNEIYYPGVAAGVAISHYAAVAQTYRLQPIYAAQTEIFEARTPESFAAESSTSVGAAAAAQESINARGAGYARSDDLQNMTRTGMYSAQAVSNDAVVREATAVATHDQRTAEQRTQVPQMRAALAFDFARGEWVLATTRTVAGERPRDPPAPTAPAPAPTPTPAPTTT